MYISAILVAKEAAAMASGSGAGPGFVGIANGSGWMIAKVAGFMETTMRPVNPLPRFDLIEARFPLCPWSVIILRLGSPTILVRTGLGKTAKSWSAFSGIGQLRAKCLYWVGADRPKGDISRGKGRYGRQEVTKEKFRVAGTGVSSGTGRRGEWSWAGGIFTNN